MIDQVPPHDLLVGGFPCQDYSVASTGAKAVSYTHLSFSVSLSANLTDNARPSMQKTSWASIFRFLSIHLLILKNFYYPVDLSVISGV